MRQPQKQKKQKIAADKDRVPVSFITYHAWINYPTVISFLQQSRDELMTNPYFQHSTQYKGMNATIIILTTCAIEGFLCECLKTFANPFKPVTTMQDRLERDYLQAVNWATLDKMPDLFKAATGKSLSELFNDATMSEKLEMLSSLRNTLAHGKSVAYANYMFYDIHTPTHIDQYEPRGKYATVEKYLIKHRLIRRGIDFKTKAVADFFAPLFMLYYQAALKLLPTDNVKKLRVIADSTLNARPILRPIA
jgi:hypothetical protein